VQAIDARTVYRAPRLTPKPVVHGAQTAMVVGGSGDEIYTDKYGRVKVQFPWDRYAKGDENSSCWVRVAQLWAGKQWGAIHIPRVGQEVIVDFLEGDPDRPIITGRVYNADSMPPYTLPDNATQSGVKSRSSKGGSADTYNELRFEDKTGQELVLLHAEKDLTIESEHDGSTSIGHDQTTSITNNLTTKVGADEERDISGNLKTSITKDETHSVSQDRNTSISGNDSSTVSKQYSLTATDQISLTTGQSSIVMKSNGEIQISGDKITLSGTSKVVINGMEVDISGTTKVGVTSNVSVEIKGTQTKVGGTMLQLSGDAMAQLKGGMTMIG
jgi:type VI secretion system secreted protein VgrG